MNFGGFILIWLALWLNVDVAWGALTPQQQAQALVAQMTQNEKINLVHGFSGPYVGNVAANTRLGIPAINLQDGPQGVGDNLVNVTAWPASLAVAATWDLTLMYNWGSAMAQEQRGKGTNVMLGPDINIARVPMGGRIFEMFGEDPVLTGKMATASVTGIQSQGVIAGAKHFVDNDQEYERTLVSIQVDERTQWEIYYAPFMAAVQAGVGAIMCSYNMINNTYACENNQTLSDLKNKMGFQGWVMSDWGATHSTNQAANTGLDMEMPGSTYFGSALNNSVNAGLVPISRLNDMATRILTSLYSAGLVGSITPTGNTLAVVTSTAHNQLAYTLAANSITLLKNDGILPLPSELDVAVIGDPPSPVGSGSGYVNPPYFVTPYAGIHARITVGRVWQAAASPLNVAVGTAARAEYVVLTVGFMSGEGADRPNLQLTAAQNQLIQDVANANPNVVVVLYGPGPVLMPWANSVRAILFGYFAGQELGNALASVLFGDVNPSGKLPVTFPVAQNDWFSGNISQYPGTEQGNKGHPTYVMDYSEGLLVGYRWYDHQSLTPLFPFGHGLSYTSFDYSNIHVSGDLTDGLTVSFTLLNNGSRSGAEVPQLYLSYPASAGEPPKVLRGFTKVTLAPEVSTAVSFTLFFSDISIWDINSHAFEPVRGTFQVLVGSSSRDIRLTSQFTYAPEIICIACTHLSTSVAHE